MNLVPEIGLTVRCLLITSDVVHQLSSILLVKNHDGIFALRSGSYYPSILKFRALINYSDQGRNSIV